MKLKSGRVITLESLNQEKTYGGLLEGIPRKEMNDRIIERCKRQAIGEHNHSIYLVEPVRRIEPRSDDPNLAHCGPAEYLPNIVCYGMFSSARLGDNKMQDESRLVIVWFQNRFALPIDAAVWAQIEQVNWEEFAGGWTY